MRWGEIEELSFRGDAKHRTRNLEIPRCAIAHLRSGANAQSRNDWRQLRRLAEIGVEMLQPRHHFLAQEAKRIVPGFRLVLVVKTKHQQRAKAADLVKNR